MINDFCVSVCMITYNQENYISQAIEGVLMQKVNFPIELVIGEDCSMDNTRSICLEYKKKYPNIIKLLLPENNMGMMQNFIATMQACTGKYTAFCEGDDYWIDPLKLQKQVDFLESNIEYSLCFHLADVFFENKKKLKNNLYENLKEGEYSANEIMQKWTIPTASVLFHTRFTKNIKWDQRFVFGDIVLFLSMAQYGKIYCLGDTMSVYRRLDSGMMLSSNKGDIINTIKKRIAHYEALKEHFVFVDEKIINNIMSSYYVSLFLKYIIAFDCNGLLFICKKALICPKSFVKIFFIKIGLSVFRGLSKLYYIPA